MRAWLKALSWVTAIAALVLFALYEFEFDVWTIPSDDPVLAASLLPTLAAGDVVVVTRHTTPARGYMLRCADPQAPGRYILARALGKAGETIDIQNEVVSVDRHRMPSPRACDQPKWTVVDPNRNDELSLACSVEDYGEMTFGALRSSDHPEPPTSAKVEAGKWYFVSDDRHIHLDSRDFGQIDAVGCQHVILRLFGAQGLGDAQTRFTVVW